MELLGLPADGRRGGPAVPAPIASTPGLRTCRPGRITRARQGLDALLLATTVCQAVVADETADEAAVWALEEAYWEYVENNDIDGYLTLWDDRFVGWPSFALSPLGKAGISDWIAPLHADPGLRYRAELSKEAVRAFGNIVVAHYLVTDYHVTPAGARQGEDTYRITHTWRRNDDGWQIITGMSASWAGGSADE